MKREQKLAGFSDTRKGTLTVSQAEIVQNNIKQNDWQADRIHRCLASNVTSFIKLQNIGNVKQIQMLIVGWFIV